MLTRCPACGTAFRVTPEQLKARSGRVRCGACQRVFNALETLAEEQPAPSPAEAHQPAQSHAPAADETAAAPAPEPANEMAKPAGSGEHADESGIEQDEASVPPGEAGPETPEAASEPPPAASAIEAASDGHEADEPAPMPEATEVDATAATGLEATEPEAAEPEPQPATEEIAPAVPSAEPEPRPRRIWPWALGAFVALLALALQALMHFRVEIATLYPDTRPLFETACSLAGCKVPRPRKPELIGIESSELANITDGRLALNATLKNRAPFAQEFPYLELTLTDTADRPLVRRVLAPADYLPAQTSVAGGFGARDEIAVNLSVAAPDVAAAGYRLYLFYP